jgi:nucleoporin p58/p45
MHIGKELKERKLSEQATKGKELICDVHKASLYPSARGAIFRVSLSTTIQELGNATSTLRADVHSTKDLKAKADQCVQDTIVAIRILDGHRNAQNGAYLKNHATFPLEFFDRITVQMKERLHWYKTTIEVRNSWSPYDFSHKRTFHSKSNGNCLQPPHKRSILHNVKPPCPHL